MQPLIKPGERAITKLRKVRQDKEIAQYVAAAAVDISNATLSRAETGKIMLPPAKILELAAFYRVHPDALCGIIHLDSIYKSAPVQPLVLHRGR